MNNCPYCHNYRTKGRNYGKFMYEYTQWWDWIRKTKRRKKVIVRILSPENKHPRLRANILFRDNPEAIVDMEINYCPKCGRKLGDPDEHIQ